MRPSSRLLLLCVLLAGSSVLSARAQDAPPSLEAIRAALDAGAPDEAERLARQRLADGRRGVEARVLLALALLERAEPDYRAALAEVDRAVLHHDEHAAAQHVRLRVLRAYKPPAWPPSEWRFAKRDLAQKLLRLDPGNRTAQLELGLQAAEDAARYHAGVKLGRGMYMAPLGLSAPTDALGQRNVAALDDTQQDELVWLFDTQALERQGIALVSYEDRADGAFADAQRYLGAALRADPSDAEPMRPLLLNLLLRARVEAADTLLALLADQRPDDATPWWLRGYLRYEAGDLPAADAAFREALQRTDASTRALLTSPALVVDEAARARALGDLAFAQTTWQRLDPRRLTPLNERRLEHYARVAYADLVYGGPDYGGRRGWETEPGRTYIRYGPPRERVQFIPDVTGDSRTLARTYPMMTWDYGDFRVVFDTEPFSRDYRYYSPSMDELASSGLASHHDYVMQMEARVREEPTRSQYAPARRVSMPFLASVFRGEDGRSEVVVPFGVPVARRPETGALPLALRTGVYLLDEDTVVDQVETARPSLDRTRIRPTATAGALYTEAPTLRAEPGAYALAVEFEAAAGQVAGYSREGVVVPDASPGLAVSDVLLAYYVEEVEPGRTPSPHRLVRRGFEIDPAPWGVFGQGQTVFLYVEVYGLASGADGHALSGIEAAIAPVDERGLLRRLLDGALGADEVEGVATRFEQRGAPGTDVHALQLDLSALDPGDYVLAFRVTNAGRSATTERRLRLD